MWNFSSQKESTDNHDWRPGSLGAGYITAPTNTPDSFDLLNMDVRTWVIGPDQTQDVHREYMRSRPVTPILFQFYISPTGGIHDGGKGFKNRTGKPVKAVIEYLRRLDNRLYDGNEEIKVNRLSKAEPHFNPDTGMPCYCGMGLKTSMLKEATKYKEFMRGEVPKQIAPEEVEKFQNYINAFVEGNGFNPVPGMKKLVPWILQKVRTGELKWEGNYNKFGRVPGGLFYDLDDREGDRQIALGGAVLEELSNLFNSEASPFKLEGEECDHPAIDPATGNCEQCFDSGIKPTGTERVDLLALPINDVIDRARGHVRWVREKEKQAEIQARIQDQEIVFGPGTDYEFSDEDKKDWYVTKMNPSAEEAKWEGIAQGNCFQNPQMPYQDAVERGQLTVYVLRDPTGRGHALWGYNPDGTVRVMEDSSKMYNKPGSGWQGYDINNPWIRSMVSETNQALGLSDEYYGHEHDGPEELAEYQIQTNVDSIEEFFRQYGEDADLWNIAQEEVENDPDNVIVEDTYIQPGRINWDRIADDFFDQVRDPEFAEDLLNQITAIAANVGDFNSLVRAFDREAKDYAADAYLYEEGEGPPVFEAELWEDWKRLHTDRNTGEIKAPRYIPWRERERLKTDENPWAFEYPSESDVEKWHGVIPASRDPEVLKGQTVEDEIICQRCKGSGRLIDLVSGNVYCPQCKGKGKIVGPVVFPDPKSELAACQSCDGSGVDQDKVEHYKQLIENAKKNNVDNNIIFQFETILKRRDLQNTDLRCDACNGTGESEPAAKLVEDASGQMRFGKKKLWDMAPISFADELKLHVASIEPKHSHSLSWVKGGKGRGLMLNDGTLVTWPVNKKGEPQHPDMYEYLTGTKLPPAFLPEHFTEGTPFDIYEDGTLAFFSDDVPADLISDLFKIDYRLKVSKIANAGIQSVTQQLKALLDADQAPRKAYEQYIRDAGGDWEAAKAKWIKDNKIVDSSDLFGDQNLFAERKAFIQQNIETIKQSPEALRDATTIVLHFDHDVPFMQWYLQYLTPGSEDFKYVSDRIATNTGQPQQYGTQDVQKTIQGIVSKKQFTKEDAIELLEKNNWDFDANEFFMGMNDELEHTDVTHGDPEITAKIVADHLREHPDYYSRLHKTFKKSRVNHKFDFHFNPFTGEPCTCGYNYVFHANHKQASQSVRKIRNQKQKFLQGDQGQAILNYLHMLISGFGIDEQGDFGHGEVPGLEGMVPWIIKQIKTGYLRPIFDEDGNCVNIYSFYGSEDYAKRELAEKLQARPLLVYGDDEDIDDLIESNKEDGWPIVTDINTPDIHFVWCNDDTMSPEDLKTLASAVPEDCTIYLTLDTTLSIDNFLQNDPEYEEFSEERNAGYEPFVNFTDRIPREIRTPKDYGSSERQAYHRGLSFCKNGNPDLSKIDMNQLPDRHFTQISFRDWANWFNADNAPARRGRNKDQIRGAVNRAIKQMEYRRQRQERDNPNRTFNMEITAENGLFMALLAEELKVDGGSLTQQWLKLEGSGNNLNQIIEKLDKYYTANINEMDVERVNTLSNQHRKYLRDLEELERLKEMFEEIKEDSVVYRVQDPAFKGWTVNSIRDREEAEMESAVLGHCIGDDGQNYVHAIDDGRIEAFSLRDPDGIPKLTWHYNPDGTLAHIQGKSSDSYQIFRHLVTEFNSEEGRDNAGGGAGSEDDLNPGETYWQLADPTTMEEWIGQKDDPWTLAQEEAERAGERLDEECEIDGGSPQWHEIAEDFMESDDYDQSMTFLRYLTMYGGEYDMRYFAQSVRDNLAHHDAYYAEDIKDDPNSKYKDTIDLFNSWTMANTNPETGQITSPRKLYDEQAYSRVREEVRQSMGDDAANAMLPYESLPNVLGISQGGGGYFGGKYLPAMLDPRLQKTDLAPEACTDCKGSGYVYAPVRVRSSTDETQYQLIKCDRCQGTGKFTDVPAEPDIASMPVQGNPMEQMEMQAPEIPQPETQRRTMWCHFCTGRGGGRVMVPDEDGEGSHPEWKPCEQCNGTGQLQFTYEASLSPKEKAEAWDKPRIKLTAAQQAYVDGLLIESDAWQF